MARDLSIKKVLVIGSGPIIIGQAAEFDYAGTQACRALREEGVEVVLINSNPATIMTDGDIADKVYIEPLTVPVVKKLIMEEKPDSILPTLGGQNALNIAMALADEGFLEEHNVRTIGTNTDTIKLAEDRLEFKNLMERINEPCAASIVVNHVNDALEFAEKIGYPVVVRPAYTLGGTGGGIANNEKELHDICSNGLRLSRVSQCLIERCIAGWKEIEYEVMRDSAGNCITVCNMENLDPVGVHTGDSIVVAPSQTLSDKEYQMLRSSALNIITALNIEGGCNVQYALNPNSFEYCVIEVNPRVSRSSALASKATGYPIAKLAAKIALGYTLDEIKNAVTGKTYASYEPTLDYVVCKIPKWPFDKFVDASRKLGTQMKATGEVMSICNNFEGALMKALRSLEQNVFYLHLDAFTKLTHDELKQKLRQICIYPVFLLCVLAIVIMLMIFLVIPAFADIFQRMHIDLPYLTATILSIGLNIKSHFIKLCTFLLMIFIAIIFVGQKDKLRLVFLQYILNLPVFGDFLRKFYLVNIVNQLIFLLGSGISIDEALNIMLNSNHNILVQDNLKTVQNLVKQGFSLADAFAKVSLSVNILQEFIDIGEKTGMLKDILSYLISFWEKELDNTIKICLQLLEPILMISVGFIVGIFIIAIIMPLFDLVNNIGL